VASSGGVARDSQGSKGAWCKLYRGIFEPLVTEDLALRYHVVFAKEHHLIVSFLNQIVRIWCGYGKREINTWL
jgi:hypothetical protein